MAGFEKIADDIRILRSPFGGVWTGITLVCGKKNYLIDSGGNAEGVDKTLLPALSDVGLSLGDIDFLLNTHTHGDHIGGHRRIRELCPSIRIPTSRESAPKMRDPLRFNRAIREVFPLYSPAPSAGLCGVEPDGIIGDGETLNGEMTYLSAPGHDDDSGCWFHIPSGTLIAGDTLQMNGTTAQGIGLYMDLPAYRKTLAKLRALAPRNILTGHEFLPLGETAIGASASDAYLALCEKTVAEYDAFIREKTAEGLDAPAIAQALCRQVGNPVPAYLFLPLYTVTEHLKEIKK